MASLPEGKSWDLCLVLLCAVCRQGSATLIISGERLKKLLLTRWKVCCKYSCLLIVRLPSGSRILSHVSTSNGEPKQAYPLPSGYPLKLPRKQFCTPSLNFSNNFLVPDRLGGGQQLSIILLAMWAWCWPEGKLDGRVGCLLIIVQREDCICLDALKWKETVIEIVATCTHNLHWMCADASMKGEEEEKERGTRIDGTKEDI